MTAENEVPVADAPVQRSADWHETERARNRELIRSAPRELLERIVEVAADTLTTVDNWLGQASTKNTAADSLWRLSRALRAIKVRVCFSDLHWRGSLIANLERAGWRMGEDGELRKVLPGQRSSEYAEGESLYWFTARHSHCAIDADDEMGPHGV